MTAPVETPNEQSWQSIRQTVAAGRMTPHGIRRLGGNVLRTIASTFLFCGVVWVAVYLWYGFEKPAETLAPVVEAKPLREVVVLSDGVLTRPWVVERLVLPDGIALVAVDLEKAKAALETEGQVRTAVVARSFPSTLVVTLEERVPVVRARVAIEAGRAPEQLFIARDGVVFRGYNFDPAMVASLPWIDGVRLRRQGGGFEPVAGIGTVSDLFLAVHQEAPHLVSSFRVVSLEDWPRLVVRTPEIREVVFEPGNYRVQLARFDYIVDFFRQQPRARVPSRIDLSIPSQVTVRFAHGATTAALSSPSTRNPANTHTHRALQR